MSQGQERAILGSRARSGRTASDDGSGTNAGTDGHNDPNGDVPHPAETDAPDRTSVVPSFSRRGTPTLPEGLRLWADTDDAPLRPLLHSDAYHGPVGNFLHHVADNSEADPAGVGINLLTFVGVMLGREVSFSAGRAVRHYPHVWAVVVGDTAAGGKGVAADTADLVLAKIDPDPRRWEMSGIGSGPHLIDRLSEHPRALIREHELGGVFRTCARKGETLGTTLRNAYDGKPLRAGSRGSGEQEAVDYTVGALGSITPAEYRDLTSELSIADGSANRWLPVWVEIGDGDGLMPFGDTISDRFLTETAEQITAGTSSAMGTDYVIEANSPTGDEWATFYRAHRRGTGDGGILNAFTARHVPHAVRLAIIYAAADGATALRPEHLRAAFAWCRYSAATLRHVFPRAATGDAARLLDIIRAAGSDGITEADQRDTLGRNVAGLPDLRNDLHTRSLIWPNKDRPEGGGRPAVRWFAVTAADEGGTPTTVRRNDQTPSTGGRS